MLHSMTPIQPSDTDVVRDHVGKPIAMRIYVVRGGWVSFHPNGNPIGANIRLKIKSGDWLPCAVSRVFRTGTTASEIYGVWVDTVA